jgi:hypothetical protein
MNIFLAIVMALAVLMFFSSVHVQRKSYIHEVLETCKTKEFQGKTRLISEQYGLVTDWHSEPTNAWQQARNMARRI